MASNNFPGMIQSESFRANPSDLGDHVLINGIDATTFSENDIEGIIDIPIVSYKPIKLSNDIVIQLANSIDARRAVDKLDGQYLLGNVVHASVLRSSVARPRSDSHPHATHDQPPGQQQPRSPSRPTFTQFSGHRQSSRCPPTAQIPGRPPITQPRHPAITQPGCPPILQSPGCSPILQSPGRPPIPQPGHPQPGYPPITQPGYPPILQSLGHPPVFQWGHPPIPQLGHSAIPQSPGHPPILQPGHPPILQPGHPPILQPGHPPILQPGHPPVLQPGHPPIPQSPPSHLPSPSSHSPSARGSFHCEQPLGQLPHVSRYHRRHSAQSASTSSPNHLQQATLLPNPTASYTVKVTHLSSGVTNNMLYEHFSQVGELCGLPNIQEPRNASDRKYAYVNFRSHLGALAAVSELDDSILGPEGWAIKVKQGKTVHALNSPPAVETTDSIMRKIPAKQLPSSELPRSNIQQPYRQTASSPALQSSAAGFSLSSADTCKAGEQQKTSTQVYFHVAEEEQPMVDSQCEHQILSHDPVSEPCSKNQANPDEECTMESGIQDFSPTDLNPSVIVTGPTSIVADDNLQSTVIFKIRVRTNKDDFRRYLDENLSKQIRCEVFRSTKNRSGTEVEVRFRNRDEAMSSVQVLRCSDPSLGARLKEPQIDLVKLEESVISFRANIEQKKSYYLSKHVKLVDDLKKERPEIPKKCTIEMHQEITAKRKVIDQAIEERLNQQEEFETYCEQLQRKLNKPSELLQDRDGQTISRLRRSFGVECNRFAKVLPIYAHRSRIVNTVKENQVCILIGETGSGKSTQLVQYLYDAGFAKQGIIVCTQPRKVAAVSLAEHVSTEMSESRVGNVLGYKTGMRGKFCDSTKVIYMTDHTLLNECILDPTFTKYSCLVIDEAHERSLSTDILLAFIKRSLCHRSDLRVIITSATIDPDLFVRYFDSGDSCPVVRVPGRTFPVEVNWDPLQSATSPIEGDYVSNAVEVVRRVHSNEPPGDILVFLTSPPDIEKACKSTTDKLKLGDEALILPLHGKLQPDEQRKVFCEDHEIRKIIFATNVAETSVTIPGVKYVVDTGLAKELCFDPKRNMNSLEVRVISKSSAEQRKGRAGRTSAGKCFRLYTEEHYEEMPQKMLPEILRVALSSAVLKLYEFGISDILSFQFVESPDPVALETAIDNLKFLGAIEHDKLTDLGRQMASLSMDPHLAKILFDGIKAGIGAEALASVCISMLAGSVFFRAGSDEQKQESDIQRISFLHSRGDQMTCLQTYHEWSLQPRDQQNQWCVEKYVNAKSMRMIKESINETRDTLEKKFEIKIPAASDNLEQAEDKLPQLYFQTFIRNLCVFLGHEKVGYFNLNLPDEQLVVFPGSSLRQMNEVPLYLVYEKTLKTSQHFMLQVLKVEEEWVREAVATKKLTVDPSQLPWFQHLRVSILSFQNLSNYLFNSINKEREVIITELNSLEISPVFETSQRKLGKLDVVVQSCYHERVSALIQTKIDSIREDLMKQTREHVLNRDGDDVRVILGNGGSILRLLMPHEYRKVVVKGPKEGEWKDEVSIKLQSCGDIQNPQFPKVTRNECLLFVEFQTPESANMAVTSLECPENVRIEPQNRVSSRGGFLSFSLEVKWCRRNRTNCAFINFTNEEDKIIALSQLGSVIMIAGNFVKVKPSTKNDRQLFLPKVALHMSEEDMKTCILPNIPQVQPENVSITLGRQKSFKTTPEKYQALKEELNAHILQSTTKDKYTLELLKPEDFHYEYRAYINFKNSEDGQRSLQSLVSKTVDGSVLSVKPNLSSTVRYQPDVYNVIKESVETETRQIEERFPGCVKIVHDKVDKRGNVVIKITSNDVPAFIAAKHALSTVINPEVIDCHTPELQGFIHTTNIKTVLSRIEKETNTLIRIDYRTVNIKMYGTQANISQAKIQFNASLSVFADGTKCNEIQLKKPGMPPGVMKYLVSQFGHGLEGLEGRDGVKSARLNPQRQILTIFGSSRAHLSVLNLIEQYVIRVNANPHVLRPNPDEIECCVCFSATSNHLSIIRLECCGHAYCLDCISLQVSPSVLAVPVECAECSKPFVLKDFDILCKRNVLKMTDLILVSVRSYIAANPTVVHVCPTPDCDMVYNITEDGQCYTCSQCGVMTCTKCHEPFHDGLSCEMYQEGKKVDKALEQWLREAPQTRKRCPKCTTPIEKVDGCNYIYCESCKARICWRCLEYFDTDDGCYTHLRNTHGSYYDN